MRTIEDLRDALHQPPAPATLDPTRIISRARRGRAVRRGAFATVVVGVTALAVTAGVLQGSPGRDARTGAAGSPLEQVADRAAAAPAPDTTTVWYTSTRQEYVGQVMDEGRTGSFYARTTSDDQVWVELPDRRRADVVGNVTPFDQAAWVRAGSPTLLGPATFTDTPGTLGSWQFLIMQRLDGQLRLSTIAQYHDYLASLPTDQGKLLGWLRAGVEPEASCWLDRLNCTTDEAVVTDAVALLTAPWLPPKLRAALLRLIGGTANVTQTEGGQDSTGRPAVRVTMTGQHSVYEIMIDPQTGAVLEDLVRLTDLVHQGGNPSLEFVPAGETVQRYTYLSAGPVKSVGATS